MDIERRSSNPSESQKTISDENFLGRPLTEEEKVSLWAYSTVAEYSRLPKGNNRERKIAENLVRQVASELILHPEKMIIAGQIWKTQQPKTPDLQRKSFYEEVSETTALFVRNNRAAMHSDQLGGFIRAYSYGQVASDLGGGAVAAYFKGPENPKQAADAFYVFIDATLDLITDQKAFEDAVRIGMFDSPLLPRGSDFWNQISIARATINDDQLLRRAYIPDNIIAELCTLTSMGKETLIAKNWDYQMTVTANTKSVKRGMEKMLDKAVKQFGRTEAINRSLKLAGTNLDLRSRAIDATSDEAIEQLHAWPGILLYTGSDPLRAKYMQVVEPQIAAQYLRREVMSSFRQHEEVSPAALTIPLPGDQVREVMDIYVSGLFDLADKSALVRRTSISAESMREVREKALARISGLSVNPIPLEWDTINGHPYCWGIRQMSVAERLRHPITALGEIGFPMPVLPNREDVYSAISRLHQNLLSSKSRYLNRRGYQSPFVDRSFRDLGYQSITFFQDTDNLHASRVQIDVNGLAYSVKLNRFFNLDLEGKMLDNPVLEQNLSYTLLFLLNDILCEKSTVSTTGESVKENEQSRETAEQLAIRTRIGHLRWLPLGQCYSEQAIVVQARETGEDLRVIQYQRWAKYPEKREHFTTYVSPVWKVDESPEPIIVNVPHIDGFNR